MAERVWPSIAEEQLAALGANRDDPTLWRLLATAQRAKSRLLLWGVKDLGRRSGNGCAERLEENYRLLAELEAAQPETVSAVVGHPAVMARAMHTINLLRTGPGRRAHRPAILAQVAAAALARTGATGVVEVPVTTGTVMLPAFGRARVGEADRTALVYGAPDGVLIRTESIEISIPRDDTVVPGWCALRTVSALSDAHRITLTIDDVDPYRMLGAPLAGRLPEHEVDRWEATLGAAWGLLVGRHRVSARRVRSLVRVLCPLVRPPRGQRSATSPETFGCLALSAPHSARDLAVTLVHEAQHAKLMAVMDMVRLTRPDSGLRFHAAWRPDARPAYGLLHGAYAHLAISDFWRRQRHHETGPAALRADGEFVRWRDGAHDATRALLASGTLTSAGVLLATAMADVLRGWR